MGEVVVPALRGANLEIGKEFVSIMGPSGSGKSTLLHMMGVLDRPTSGEIFIDGTETSKLDDSQLARLRGQKIGFVFQSFNLYPTLTAQENIELPMTIIETQRDERRRRAKSLLEMVGLDDRANHIPSQLSGGQRQRVAIARALANKPPIILADEPTGNLDTKSGEEVINFLEKLQKEEDISIVIVTHEPEIVERTERTINLKDGRIIGGE
ncbi:MAG: ABC transporter ATP-binding protein [Halobacteriota archaeon]|nr:ABC transporter ATP-binding protein [Halobacteriota archaeon]